VEQQYNRQDNTTDNAIQAWKQLTSVTLVELNFPFFLLLGNKKRSFHYEAGKQAKKVK
jgi:hypothetical protein